MPYTLIYLVLFVILSLPQAPSRPGEQSVDKYYRQDAGATERPVSVYKMLTSAGDGLTLERPLRVLHAACLSPPAVHVGWQMYINLMRNLLGVVRMQRGVLQQPHTLTKARKKRKTRTHTCRRTRVGVGIDCRYVHACARVCAQRHVATSAEQRTLLDYFNSVSFDWFRAL